MVWAWWQGWCAWGASLMIICCSIYRFILQQQMAMFGNIQDATHAYCRDILGASLIHSSSLIWPLPPTCLLKKTTKPSIHQNTTAPMYSTDLFIEVRPWSSTESVWPMTNSPWCGEGTIVIVGQEEELTHVNTQGATCTSSGWVLCIDTLRAFDS